MTNAQKWFVLICLTAGLSAGPVIAQLNQSGGPGSTVTANQGGSPWAFNETQVASTAIDVNSGNKSAGTQRIVLATDQPQLTNAFKVDGSAVTQPVSGTLSVNALPAGSNVIGKTAWPTGCGVTPFDSGFTANIATGGTDLATSATCVFALLVSNTTGSAVTFTLKDKAGTPNTYINTFSLPANSNQVLQLWGVKFTGGVNLTAGTGSALQAQLVGLQ